MAGGAAALWLSSVTEAHSLCGSTWLKTSVLLDAQSAISKASKLFVLVKHCLDSLNVGLQRLFHRLLWINGWPKYLCIAHVGHRRVQTHV